MKKFFVPVAFLLLIYSAGSLFAVSLNIPPRPADAMTGSQFVAYVTSMTRDEREKNIYNQITMGNIPDFYRTLRPITVSASIGGSTRALTYYVTPDYLAIGSNADYFLCPMTPILAQQVADYLGCSLPTRKISNDIWTNAAVKMNPQPITASPQMTTVPVFNDHNTMVWDQRKTTLAQHPLGSLVAGDKKDVVITIKLYPTATPPRVAIYGWHKLDGTVWQSLYLGHESTYADYSHGIRMVEKDMVLDGQPTTMAQILADANLNVLLSDEGVMTQPYYPFNAPPDVMPFVDAFPSDGRQLKSWVDRFTAPVLTAFTPASPDGDGTVLVVKDASGGVETARIGFLSDENYYTQCDIYCNYRPALATDGFERVGIFIRDNGNGVFEHTTAGGGYCYGMAWDSGDGRLWCFKSVNGAITDLNPSPIYRASTAWRRFRIEALGSNLVFKCDGETVLDINDATFAKGQCGIGYHEYFKTNTNMLGTYADNFRADRLTTAPVQTPTPTPTPAPSPTPLPENLLKNGSFEEGFTSGVGNFWTKWEAAGSSAITFGTATKNVHDGANSQYWARNDTSAFQGGVYQRVTVVPGTTYRITAWIKHQSYLDGNVMDIGYDLSGGTDGMGASVVYASFASAAYNEWASYSQTVKATGNAITVFARAGHTGVSGGTSAYYYFDEARMAVAEPEPTPTPTPTATPVPSPSPTKVSWGIY